MVLYYCSGNLSKIYEVTDYFKNTENIIIESYKKEFIEIQSSDVMEILKFKASQIDFSCINADGFIIDDSGIYINNYNNFPGTITKYIWNMIGSKGLKKLVDGCNEAEFHTYLLLCLRGEKPIFFEGKLKGRLVFLENMGNQNELFPFSDLFIPDGQQKTLTELMQSNSFINHRKLALDKMRNYLLNL